MKLKHFILCLLCLVTLTSYGQKARRVYRSGDYLVVADSAGSNPIAYPVKNTSLSVKGYLIIVQTTAGAFAYLPSQLLNQSGVAYSTVGPIEALTSFLASVPASSTVSGSGVADASQIVTGTISELRLPSTVILTSSSIVNPTFFTALDPSRITQNATFRAVSDNEKTLWNSKIDATTSRTITHDSIAANLRTFVFTGPGVSVTQSGQTYTVTVTGAGSSSVTVDNVITQGSQNPPSSDAVKNYVDAAGGTLQTQLNSVTATANQQASQIAGLISALNAVTATVGALGTSQNNLQNNLQGQINALQTSNTTPNPPTSSIVDDAANTFNWTNSTTSGLVLSDYEYTLDFGGTYSTASAKPISVGDVALAIGQVGVRVKAASGRNVSTTLFNTTAFTQASVQLGAPTLTFSNVTATGATISWNTVSNATTYTLERDVSSGFSSPTTAYSGSGTTYTETGRSATTTYYYRIRATGGTGFSPSNYGTGNFTTLAAYTVREVVRLVFQTSTTGATIPTSGTAIVNPSNVNRMLPTSANVTTSNSYTLNSLVTEAGVTTGYSAAIGNAFTGSSASSLSATQGSLYPDQVLARAYLVSSANSSGGSIIISGLNPSDFNQLQIYGGTSSSNAVVKYTVTGATSSFQTKTVSNNTGVGGGDESVNPALVVFRNVQADAQGRITILMNNQSGPSSPMNLIKDDISSLPKP